MSKKTFPRLEIKNIRFGNKANEAYPGQSDRSHILFAQVWRDGEMVMNATLDTCVQSVESRMNEEIH